jgi:hypothetical protein
MSPLEIRELPMEVSLTTFECDGLDKAALAGQARGGQLRRPGEPWSNRWASEPVAACP